ncbi:transposable element Tcb1 transposase [Trichonephila clavipes]|nr:transposable element Tcb1 transposase [Trichonephila clavipes]
MSRIAGLGSNGMEPDRLHVDCTSAEMATSARVTIHGRAPRSHFSTRQSSARHSKEVSRLPPPHYHPSMACSIPRFVTNLAYLRSFRMASWTAYELGRNGGALTATVERDVSGHHTKLLCLNARSNHIVHLC